MLGEDGMNSVPPRFLSRARIPIWKPAGWLPLYDCLSLSLRLKAPGIYGRLEAYIDSNTVLGLVLAQRR